MDNFAFANNLPKLNQDQLNGLNSFITPMKLKRSSKVFQPKNLGPDDFKYDSNRLSK